MNSERWQKVKGLFDAVVELAPRKRKRFLDKSCGTDKELRREVENLLASYSDAESFMEQPAAYEVASLIIEPKNLETGKSFGHYEIIRQIGTGGMGEVYLAEDKKLDRRVAIKILNQEFSRHESNLQRFIQEAKAASALNHPNILVIHEIGETADANFIVSEFIEGKTLREHFKELPMKLSEVLDIAIQTANALSAAHTAGIVHRDIKPENIMIRPDGYVKILDFGLAKLVEQKAVGLEDETAKQNQTAKGVILGTVKYMSPEQAKGEKVERRTDIFSLGVVIYEMIAGRTPFAGNSMSETLANLINAEPQPLLRYAEGVPDELQRIVSKMLRKNKTERYQTMKDLFADLKNLQKRQEFETDDDLAAETGEPKFVTKPAQSVTADNEIHHSTSSAEYIVTEIKNHKRGFFWILAALLIGIVGFSAYYFYQAGNQPKFSSIAVLPLNNASGDANLDYLSDGLSENLINKLSQIGQLKVIAQSSAFRYKGKDFDPKEAGQTLGVEVLLTGRITKFGDGLSIGIELIDARDGTIIWNEKYNLNSFDAAFDTQLVQGRIALQIAAKLNLDLTGTQNEQLKKRSTQNPQAYQLFLNAALIKRKSNSVEASRKAIDYYNQAITLDPDFALAYVSLANSYRYLHTSSSVGNKKEIEEKMHQAIAKAQELDDTLPEIYTTLGGIKQNEFDLPGAEKAYKRAIELNPNSPGAHSGYANYLTNVGKFDEALTHVRLAQQLDPLSMGLKIVEGRTLFAARRYDEAIRRLQTLAKTAPNNPAIHYYLAISYTFKGMFAEAIAAHEKTKEISGEKEGEFYIYTLAKAGKTEQARQYLEKAKKRENYSPAEFAVAYIALGDKEQAFATLEKAYQERDPQLQYLKIDPHYDEIRSDPRFQDLLRRVGFPTD